MNENPPKDETTPSSDSPQVPEDEWGSFVDKDE